MSASVVFVVSFNGEVEHACSEPKIDNEWQVVEGFACVQLSIEEGKEQDVETKHRIGKVCNILDKGFLARIPINNYCPVPGNNLKSKMDESQACVDCFSFGIEKH